MSIFLCSSASMELQDKGRLAVSCLIMVRKGESISHASCIPTKMPLLRLRQHLQDEWPKLRQRLQDEWPRLRLCLVQDEWPCFNGVQFVHAVGRGSVFLLATILLNLVSNRISNEEATHTSLLSVLVRYIPLSFVHYLPLTLVTIIAWCIGHKFFIHFQGGLPVVVEPPQSQAIGHPYPPHHQGTAPLDLGATRPPHPQSTLTQANGHHNPQGTGHIPHNQGSGPSHPEGTGALDPQCTQSPATGHSPLQGTESPHPNATRPDLGVVDDDLQFLLHTLTRHSATERFSWAKGCSGNTALTIHFKGVVRDVEIVFKPKLTLSGSKVLYKRLDVGPHLGFVEIEKLRWQLIESMRQARALDPDCTLQVGSFAVLKYTDSGRLKWWRLHDHWIPKISEIRASPWNLLDSLSGSRKKWTVRGFHLQGATLKASMVDKSESLKVLRHDEMESGEDLILCEEPRLIQDAAPTFWKKLYICASKSVKVEEGVIIDVQSQPTHIKRAYWILVLMECLIPSPWTLIIMLSLSLILGGLKHDTDGKHGGFSPKGPSHHLDLRQRQDVIIGSDILEKNSILLRALSETYKLFLAYIFVIFAPIFLSTLWPRFSHEVVRPSGDDVPGPRTIPMSEDLSDIPSSTNSSLCNEEQNEEEGSKRVTPTLAVSRDNINSSTGPGSTPLAIPGEKFEYIGEPGFQPLVYKSNPVSRSSSFQRSVPRSVHFDGGLDDLSSRTIPPSEGSSKISDRILPSHPGEKKLQRHLTVSIEDEKQGEGSYHNRSVRPGGPAGYVVDDQVFREVLSRWHTSDGSLTVPMKGGFGPVMGSECDSNRTVPTFMDFDLNTTPENRKRNRVDEEFLQENEIGLAEDSEDERPPRKKARSIQKEFTNASDGLQKSTGIVTADQDTQPKISSSATWKATSCELEISPPLPNVEIQVDAELWYTCAGLPQDTLPPVNSLVAYFPQGHIEQICTQFASDTVLDDLDMEGKISSYNLPAAIPCTLKDVRLSADPHTDEVFAILRLSPVSDPTRESSYSLEALEPPKIRPPKSVWFMKVLTVSDTSPHGGFNVPRLGAEHVFPPMDTTQINPVQVLIAKDLQGNEYRFRHLFRGQPRRHLLTTGWSIFVSEKRLVAGDSVGFFRGEDGQLRISMVRSRASTERKQQSAMVTIPTMVIGALEAAAHAVSQNSPFSLIFSPRSCSSQFILPYSKYANAMKTTFSAGTRINLTRMSSKLSSGNRARDWSTGTITEISDYDHARWPGSLWRSIQVNCDETARQERVSPWEITPILHASQLSRTWPQARERKRSKAPT